MNCEETLRGIGMQDTGYWNPAVKDRCRSIPRQRPLLAAATENPVPQSTQTPTKDTELIQISRDRVVSVVTDDNLLDPCTDLGNRFVHPVTQLRINCTQLRDHPLPHRLPSNDERAVAPPLPAVVREAQEGERFGFSLSTLLSILDCEPPELDQPCLVRM